MLSVATALLAVVLGIIGGMSVGEPMRAQVPQPFPKPADPQKPGAPPPKVEPPRPATPIVPAAPGLFLLRYYPAETDVESGTDHPEWIDRLPVIAWRIGLKRGNGEDGVA